jgi:hypothetical protein
MAKILCDAVPGALAQRGEIRFPRKEEEFDSFPPIKAEAAGRVKLPTPRL